MIASHATSANLAYPQIAMLAVHGQDTFIGCGGNVGSLFKDFAGISEEHAGIELATTAKKQA